MKERMHSYFEYMRNSREAIAKVERAKAPEEIIKVYVKWYFEQYLYHHNEQFIDFFEFITAIKILTRSPKSWNTPCSSPQKTKWLTGLTGIFNHLTRRIGPGSGKL